MDQCEFTISRCRFSLLPFLCRAASRMSPCIIVVGQCNTLSPPVIRPGRRFKGIVHPKVIFHPFITYARLARAVFSNPCNHSGVSQTERI